MGFRHLAKSLGCLLFAHATLETTAVAETTRVLPFMRRGRLNEAAAPFLSKLLWLANSRPPHLARSEFYAVKDIILRRFGDRVGHDWQEIVHECYGCDGTGIYTYLEGDSTECRRCFGSGVYRRFWVRLERWQLAGRTFHRPVERTANCPDEPVTIVGRIEHKRVGRAGDEACLWLALVFDRRLFRRLMTGSYPCGNTLPYPLVTIRKGTASLARWFGRLAGILRWRRCWGCGRGFSQVFRDWRMRRYYCRRCEPAANGVLGDSGNW